MCAPIQSPAVPVAPPILCRHCQERSLGPGGARGLCPTCYQRLDIRARYPVKQRLQRKNPCRHCQRRSGKWSRGLCGPCFRQADVLALYPPTAPQPSAPKPSGRPFLKGYTPWNARPNAPKCQHCHLRPIGRPRKLCWTCFSNDGIRAMYPHKAKRGVGHGNRGYALPLEPTSALPGTEAKVQVLIQRMAEGWALWHPMDAG
jgi:hypothetical protein